MRAKPYALICPNAECNEEKLEYEKGEGRLACPKCSYSTTYFAEDYLQFHFKLRKTKFGPKWKLDKVYWDTIEWEDDWKKLRSPKAMVSWSIPSGCNLIVIMLEDGTKFETSDKSSLDMKFLEQLPGGGRFEIYHHVSNFVQEWAAGISFPVGWDDD